MRTLNFGWIDSLGTQLSLFLENRFRALGRCIGNRPWVWILCSVTVALICCLGFFNFEEEFRGEKLWNPTGTAAARDKDYVEDNYWRPSRLTEVVILDPANDDEANVLKPEVFNQLFEFQNRVMDLRAKNPDFGKPGQPQTLVYNNRTEETDDALGVCFIRGDYCDLRTLPDAMGNNPVNWTNTEKILDFINQGMVTTSRGYPFHASVLLGGIVRDEDGQIIRAKAITSRFPVQNNEIYTKNAEPDDLRAKEWEGEFLDEAEAWGEDQDQYEVLRATYRSFEDEFQKTVDDDLQILNVAIILLLLYTITMMSRWSEGWVGFRFLLSIGGFISIGIALVAALGLGSAFGIFYSQLMNIYPFLLIGIGVDDVFVLVNALDGTPRSLPLVDRLSNALAVSGTSITVTSLTDFFAFLIGSNTSLPALRNFSLYAAIGIFLTLLTQVTFFAAVAFYDAKRADYNLCGAFPCFTVKREPLLCCQKSKDTFMSRTFELLGQTLSLPWVKAIVIIFAMILVGFGIAGTVQMEVDADVKDFYPNRSYLRDWIDAKSDYFTSSGARTSVYMRDVDFTSAQIHSQMIEMVEVFRSDPWVQNYTVRSWFEKFSIALGEAPPTGEAFISSLRDWLDGDGSVFKQDIVFDDVGESIITSRMTGNHVYSDKSADWVDSMNSIRDTIKQQDDPLGSTSFAYGDLYTEYEQYKVIAREALINISLALLMVLVIVMLLLVNPVAAGMTFLAIALTVIELVGYLYWWGSRIDNVLVIFVVISLGLSVDYAVHISHMFLKTPGTPNERMIVALRDMGPAVFNGAMSTFIAAVVLSSTTSYVFQVFFKSLFLCVVLGLGHGAVFLPVCLSIFAPAPHVAEQKVAKEVQMQKTADDTRA